MKLGRAVLLFAFLAVVLFGVWFVFMIPTLLKMK